MAVHSGLCKNKRKRKQGKKAVDMTKQRRALLKRRAQEDALPVCASSDQKRQRGCDEASPAAGETGAAGASTSHLNKKRKRHVNPFEVLADT